MERKGLQFVSEIIFRSEKEDCERYKLTPIYNTKLNTLFATKIQYNSSKWQASSGVPSRGCSDWTLLFCLTMCSITGKRRGLGESLSSCPQLKNSDWIWHCSMLKPMQWVSLSVHLIIQLLSGHRLAFTVCLESYSPWIYIGSFVTRGRLSSLSDALTVIHIQGTYQINLSILCLSILPAQTAAEHTINWTDLNGKHEGQRRPLFSPINLRLYMDKVSSP